MSFSKSYYKSKRGNLIAILGSIVGVTALSMFIGQFMNMKAFSVKKKLQDTRHTISISSGIETMIYAYRLAELTYLKEVADKGCDTAAPFLVALAEGSGCPNPPIQVFTGKNKPEKTYDDNKLYSYPTGGTSGCTIKKDTKADCVVDPTKPTTVLTIGVGTATSQKFGDESYEFLLTGTTPSQGIAEFVVIVTDKNKKTNKHAFAIRSTLPNAAHIEADGRVTQETPDPLSVCQGTPWANYLLLHGKKCVPFVELGSGTGLFYYESRYFGFRPADGQIIDMLNATTGATSYLVDPSTGKIGSEKVFVPYSKDDLVNVDDLTMIDDQLYYVAHSGDSAHIGYLKPSSGGGAPFTRVRVCNLGEKGWAQAYSGIAALSWSDPLAATSTSGSSSDMRMARFFLKTDAGDLLTAFVTNTDGNPNVGEPGSPPPTSTAECHVYKDSSLQQIEYKRTYGFDRTSRARPYYLY